jgi:hypothetical protein
MLPPITYTPPPPKKVEKKTRRIGVGMLDELGETVDAREANGSGQSVPVKLPPANQPEIEGSDRKPQRPMGQLSQGMLTALLGIQEIK